MPKLSKPPRKVLSEEEVRARTVKSVSIESAVKQIEQSLIQFNKDFDEAVSDPDNFPSISTLERLWAAPDSDATRIIANHFREKMASINEAELIAKKKQNTQKKT
jgi:hypothetical protein